MEMEEYFEAKIIVCIECKTEFIFTVGEQQFYATRHPPLAEPKRCLSCRLLRKRNQGREVRDGH